MSELAVPIERTTTGKIKCLILSKMLELPIVYIPLEGKILNVTEKRKINNSAKTNEGVDIPIKKAEVTAESNLEYCLTALAIPSGMAMANPISRERKFRISVGMMR